MIREKRTVNCWLLTNKGNCEGKPTKPLQLPFILPIELITAFSKTDFIRFGQQTVSSETQPPWNKKRSFSPLIAEAHLASSSFKNYFQTRRFSSPIQTLNTGTFTPKTLTKRRDSHPNLTIFSNPMTTIPFAWFPLREPSWLSLSEVVLDCTNLSCNSYQNCENHT